MAVEFEGLAEHCRYCPNTPDAHPQVYRLVHAYWDVVHTIEWEDEDENQVDITHSREMAEWQEHDNSEAAVICSNCGADWPMAKANSFVNEIDREERRS